MRPCLGLRRLVKYESEAESSACPGAAVAAAAVVVFVGILTPLCLSLE